MMTLVVRSLHSEDLSADTNNLKEICYDHISGPGIVVGDHENIDLEKISDQLSDLRDVLEKLFKVTTASIQLPESRISADWIDGL